MTLGFDEFFSNVLMRTVNNIHLTPRQSFVSVFVHSADNRVHYYCKSFEFQDKVYSRPFQLFLEKRHFRSMNIGIIYPFFLHLRNFFCNADI